MTAWDLYLGIAGFVLGWFGYRMGRAWRRRRADKIAQKNLNAALASIERAASNVRNMAPRGGGDGRGSNPRGGGGR